MWLRSCFLLLCLIVAAPTQALRCGTDVVNEGDRTFKLLQICGEPTFREQARRRVPYRIYDSILGEYSLAYDNVPVEIWTYNFGPQRFIQYITIEDGRIKHIESGGYGY